MKKNKVKLPKGIPTDIYKVFVDAETMYLTPSYIARQTKFSKKIVTENLEYYPHVFKKSYLKSDTGQDAYFLRRNCFWKIKDIWNTICYINYLKY